MHVVNGEPRSAPQGEQMNGLPRTSGHKRKVRHMRCDSTQPYLYLPRGDSCQELRVGVPEQKTLHRRALCSCDCFGALHLFGAWHPLFDWNGCTPQVGRLRTMQHGCKRRRNERYRKRGASMVTSLTGAACSIAPAIGRIGSAGRRTRLRRMFGRLCWVELRQQLRFEAAGVVSRWRFT